LRKARITIVTLVAVMVLVFVFVPVLYSDRPCAYTYQSVSFHIFGFGGVYTVGLNDNLQGDVVYCGKPPHFNPSYVFQW
jgi:hypothetical protein